MLNQNQIEEIRNKLENAQNPLFFFDNDVDGLCSFIILQRALSRGKGVAIKSFPELNKNYVRKINELNPDKIVILDKPLVSKEFIDEVRSRNLEIIWIDHHETQIDQEILKEVSYYNSFPSAEPTTYLAQKIFNRKEDLWLAMAGCIGDVYMPEFSESFREKYPELLPKKTNAFDALYSTEIGKIARMLNLGLMDTTTNVLRLIRHLEKSNSPYDILEENLKTKHLQKKYSELNQKSNKLVYKAELNLENPLIFSYSGETSISSEVANKLYFKHPEKFIVVIFLRDEKATISIRGKNAKKILSKTIEKIENATGGGHEEACGAKIPLEKIEEFKELIKEQVKNTNPMNASD